MRRGGRAPRHAISQRGGSFAERLSGAFADAAACGYTEILAVPTDVPGLGSAQLAAAFRRLSTAPMVLGPSPDGGVYLIGCRRFAPHLFAGVRWQTGAVLDDLIGNARGRGLAPALLAPLADVDGRGGLRAFAASSGLAREAARQVEALLARPPAAPPERASAPRLPLLAPRIIPRAPPAPPLDLARS